MRHLFPPVRGLQEMGGPGCSLAETTATIKEEVAKLHKLRSLGTKADFDRLLAMAASVGDVLCTIDSVSASAISMMRHYVPFSATIVAFVALHDEMGWTCSACKRLAKNIVQHATIIGHARLPLNQIGDLILQGHLDDIFSILAAYQ